MLPIILVGWSVKTLFATFVSSWINPFHWEDSVELMVKVMGLYGWLIRCLDTDTEHVSRSTYFPGILPTANQGLGYLAADLDFPYYHPARHLHIYSLDTPRRSSCILIHAAPHSQSMHPCTRG